MLFFCISERRSKGEESREEKRMRGPGSSSSVEMGGVVEGEAVVGGADVMFGEEDSRREA